MLFEVAQKQTIPSTFLHEKYIVPPFSVFNTHQVYWRERLEKWRNFGIYIANGREAGKSYDNRRMDKGKRQRENNGTSSFNPVLCEIIYKWFMPKDGKTVFDPFAGGIVRGAVAAILDLNYVGFDVIQKQVDSNYTEWRKVQEKYQINGSATWHCIDSTLTFNSVVKYDLIFTCPPYYNLEVYSDLSIDLSNAPTYNVFLTAYEKVIENTYQVLKDDCFSVWVVSDCRDKTTTEYYGLVADTIKLHQKAGFKFYNEIILYNDTGNLAITSGDYLNKARKVGRQHQNVLVFFKGDPKRIKEKFGPVFEEA